MHPQEVLPVSIANWLNRMILGDAIPYVLITVRTLDQIGTHPGGAPIYGTTYSEQQIDVSRYIERGGVTINQSMPVMPNLSSDFSLARSTTATVTLTDPDGEYTTGTDDSIIDPFTIESGTMQISVRLSVTGDVLPLFTGAIQGLPSIKGIKATFRLQDIQYEALRTPVLFEDYITTTGIQDAGVYGTNFINYTDDIPGLFGQYRAFAGWVGFNENGDALPRLQSDDKDAIDLKSVQVHNGAKPGIYKLTFTDTKTFLVTYPDNNEFDGSTEFDFVSDHISIDVGDWVGVGAEGITIEWRVGVALFGNGISIIKNLIEKGLLKNWGELPGVNPGYSQLPVDWPAFDRLEREMDYFPLHPYFTNDDNSVWELQDGNRPLSCIQACQLIANHFLCTITVTIDGIITIKGPRIWDDVVYDVTTNEAILQDGISTQPLSGNGGRKYNSLDIDYANNDIQNVYGFRLPRIDFRTDLTKGYMVKPWQMPFYKSAAINSVQFWGDFIVRRFLKNPTGIKLKVGANYHLSSEPGDTYRVISRVRPKFTKYCRVHNVGSKRPFSDGTLSLHEVQEPEGAPFLFGSGVLCVDPVC